MSDPPFPPARVGDDLIRSDVRDPREPRDDAYNGAVPGNSLESNQLGMIELLYITRPEPDGSRTANRIPR
jgi:hypothetical protein